jgi:hypothetical protein
MYCYQFRNTSPVLRCQFSDTSLSLLYPLQGYQSNTAVPIQGYQSRTAVPVQGYQSRTTVPFLVQVPFYQSPDSVPRLPALLYLDAGPCTTIAPKK